MFSILLSSSEIRSSVEPGPAGVESIVVVVEVHDLLPDLIMNGAADIAKNLSMDTMVVGVAGRQRVSKIYVRSGTSKGGKTRQSYDPVKDMPNSLMPIIPTTKERQGRSGTLEFLVVRLVLAQEPRKYSTIGIAKAGDKSHDEARRARGALPSEANVLRALVQTTGSIDTAASIKFTWLEFRISAALARKGGGFL